MLEKIRALIPKKPSKKDSVASYAILAPLVRNQKGTQKDLFEQMQRFGFNRVRVDGNLYALSNPPELDKHYKHDVDVVVDRICVRPELFESPNLEVLVGAIDKALDVSDGQMILSRAIPLGGNASKSDVDWGCDTANDVVYSLLYACSKCGVSYPTPTPQMLSFNSPQGACETCEGLGVTKFFTEEKLVPNPALSIRDGAIEPLGTWETMPLWLKKGLGDFCQAVQKIYKLPKDPSKVPWQNLAEGIRRVLLVGDGRAYAYCNQPSTGHRSYLGIAMDMMYVYRESNSQTVKSRYDRYFEEVQCPSCQGERIQALGRSIKLKTITKGFDNLDPWRSIGQCSSMPIEDASMAQACRPCVAKARKVLCSSTGSGVVRPVAMMLSGPAEAPGNGTRPTPKVPINPHGTGLVCFKFDSACANHQAVEVLPLVPVTASTANCCEGSSK
jgi:excinuclease ABC subunit A